MLYFYQDTQTSTSASKCAVTYIISALLKICRVLFKTTGAIYLSLESVFSTDLLGEGRVNATIHFVCWDECAVIQRWPRVWKETI